MADVFDPITIGGLELQNRFMRSATWDGTAAEDGQVTDHSLALYRALGEGGIGLIATGYMYISELGRAASGQYGIYSDEMIPGLKKLAEVSRRHGSKVIAQIVHAGVTSMYLPIKGTEMLAMSKLDHIPAPHREATEEDIQIVIDDFATATVRAREAGFDGVQLHGAHGYLINQIASPLFNKRQDRWGGSAENRRRFHIEVTKRIRKAVGGDYPLHIKFGLMDDSEWGMTLDEGIETARQMVAAGMDAIEVSAGVGNDHATLAPKAGDPETTPFRERAALLKKEIDIPVMVVGGIRTLAAARDIVAGGDADMVSLCRPFIREPGLIARWKNEDTAAAKCISCYQCITSVSREGILECGQERRLREAAA